MVEVQPREIKILETVEDIQERRSQVLGRYGNFKDATKDRRERLEDARRYMYFKRDADELESWILEKLQTASDENYKDPTNLQVSPILSDTGKLTKCDRLWENPAKGDDP
jgi:spectrin alpha